MYPCIFRNSLLVLNRTSASIVRKNVNSLPRSLCNQRESRNYCSAAVDEIPLPQAEGENKVYSQKLQTIVSDISKLSLLEVADLNSLLKETLKITETPVMAMGGMPLAAQAQPVQEEEEEEKEPKKSLYAVKLTSFDATKKVALIKEIKNNIEGMNLVQAKKFVESLPQAVKTDMLEEEAEQLKSTLEAVGAEVQLV